MCDQATNGVLPDHQIRALIASGNIRSDTPVIPEQIQPASLDLRLGGTAYRLRASFLAGKGRRIQDRLVDFQMHQMDLSGGAVLERGCVYLIPLMEHMSLPEGLTAVANAKSSTGRLDLLTRLVADGALVAIGDVDAQALKDAVGDLGITASAHLDVTDPESFASFLDHVEDVLGLAGGDLVAAAGVDLRAPADQDERTVGPLDGQVAGAQPPVRTQRGGGLLHGGAELLPVARCRDQDAEDEAAAEDDLLDVEHLDPGLGERLEDRRGDPRPVLAAQRDEQGLLCVLVHHATRLAVSLRHRD